MKYPHIILSDQAVKDVRYESRGIGPKYSALDKNRQGQADMVQRWYWDAISQSKERRSNLFAKDVCADGSYIAMEIDAKHCNMDALDTSKGARLMSVNTLGNESDIQEALLFLPDRNEKWLQGKIEKYSDNSKDGKNGQPANALLINSIQSMKVAVASDFFSSKEDLQVFYTTSSKTCLSVEIWLSKDADGCSIDDTLNKLKLLHAHCSNRFIEFSNSYVVLATMPRGEIEKICYSINGLSELRIFKDARVLLEADNIGENEWVGLIKENTKSLPGLVRVGIRDGQKLSGAPSELNLVSTNSNPLIHQFGAINATSAATALAARLAAKIKHSNPTLSPLTIRGLMVHSAEWTDEMVRQCSNNGIRNIDLLLHSCGYGVPNEQKAVMSDESHVTFIAEQEIHPFDGNSKKCRFDNMHILELPWPKDLLENMGEVEVKMKVTLSFYIQPAPGAKTRLNKYAYPSSLLRFDVKTAEESYEQFEKRISHVFQDGVDKSLNDTGRWQIGIQRRNRGSVISDSFVDSAVKIASCGYIAVYPASGWLKNMNYREEYNTIKYSLIVTLETPNVNIYHAIPVMQEVMV